jgi:Asp-tRNA(Asn)/Glu-tRNA(Gln) amidotransferase A subunit family amidase
MHRQDPWVVFIAYFQVQMRILMGTYALSAGYYDAYYKRAQQVNISFN